MKDPYPLDLRVLLCGDVNQLRYVHRFSAFRCTHRENVAEHSFYTALYSMFIGNWVNAHHTPHRNVSIGRLLERAVLHDLEEARTGDILRMFKHRDPEVSAAIDRAAASEAETLIAGILPPEACDVAATVCFTTWKQAKDHTLEGRIVAFADYLSVLAFLIQEMGSANTPLTMHLADFRAYADSFNAPEFDFLRPLVEVAHSVVEEVFA